MPLDVVPASDMDKRENNEAMHSRSHVLAAVQVRNPTDQREQCQASAEQGTYHSRCRKKALLPGEAQQDFQEKGPNGTSRNWPFGREWKHILGKKDSLEKLGTSVESLLGGNG